jgi:Cytochrome c554 and c-prime
VIPPRLLLVATLVVVAAGAHASSPPPLPGPAPQARTAGYDAAAENRACEQCHADIAKEWSGSAHHRAWDDPVFQTAYAIEQLAFCRGCHAPEANPAGIPPEPARRLGVGCVTCHVQEGDIVGVHGHVATSTRHAVRGDARLATVAACEGCHQFDFPQPQHAPMQGTVDEHRASRHASESCQHCHMATVRGDDGKEHRSHDFRVSTAMLRSAVKASASRAGEHAINVSLAAGRVGHAVPTGDMFRRLQVRARIVGEGGAAAKPAVLARRFVMMPSPEGPRRIQTGDDRLPPTGDARQVQLPFAEAIKGREVRWEVAYQRMDPGMSAMFGVDPAADEVIVAEGVLAPEQARR